MQAEMEPPEGTTEIFMGCGRVDSNNLKLGIFATPAELFELEQKPFNVETTARAVRGYYTHYA